MTVYEITIIFLSVFQFITTALGVVLWSNFKGVQTVAEKTKDDLSAYKLYVAQNHPDQSTVRAILEKLDKIISDINLMSIQFNERLHGKADK